MQALYKILFNSYIAKYIRFSIFVAQPISCSAKYRDQTKLKSYILKKNDSTTVLGQKLFHFTKKNSHGHSKSSRTHACGDLCNEDVGKQVKLRGFLQFQRMGFFCILRDSSGLIQIIINSEELSSLLKNTPYESYIEVAGEVILRPKDQINKMLKTGEIEVVAKEFVVLNKAKKDIPFLIREHNEPTEILGLTYRYLDLRRQYLQQNLRFRSKLGKKMRDFLQDVEEFVEITTPTLSIRTPGGSQEFVVPSHLPGKFYSLTQSPQIYKQLAIIGGFEKYFQFAPCYRDEIGRPDRQPEFMQLDIEMADATSLEVRNLMEEIIVRSWPAEFPQPQRPFPSLSYDEAMECYGVDKPDTRFQWMISDVSGIISQSDSQLFSDATKDGNVAKAFVIPNGGKYIKNKHVCIWKDVAKKEAQLPGVLVYSVSKDKSLKGKVAKALSKDSSESLIEAMKAETGDSIVLAFGHKSKVLRLLGKLRLLAAEVLEEAGIKIRDDGSFKFLWIVDFPLFEVDEISQILVSCHHPFTAPRSDHYNLLFEDPHKARSQHYDLVLNGVEIAGGSIRIHDAEAQKHVFEILGIDSSPLKYLLEALACGAPPHGGIALGFDRYVSILRGSKSIRDVIAFPKSANGKCLMLGAPGNVSEEDRKRYHLGNYSVK